MKKTKVRYCRFVPGINGSPAWMTVEEAEAHLKKDNAHIDQMIEYCKDSPTDLEFWQSRYSHIEHVKG